MRTFANDGSEVIQEVFIKCITEFAYNTLSVSRSKVNPRLKVNQDFNTLG